MDRRQIEDAIAAVADRYWEYSYVLSKIRVYKEVPGLGTVGVDQWWRLYWDPECKVTRKQMETLVLHELGHLLGEDGPRAHELADGESFALSMTGINARKEAGPVDQLVWNMCCDARINEPIRHLDWTDFPKAMTDEQKKALKAAKKAKMPVGDGGVYPETLDPAWATATGHPVMPPEWYYVKLREKYGGQGGDGDQEGGQPGDGQGGGGMGGQINPSGSCGGVATGKQEDWEDAKDEDCMSESEQRQAIDETEQRIAEKVRGEEGGGGRSRAHGSGIGTEANFPMLLDPQKVTEKVNHQKWLATMQSIIYKHLEQARRTFEHPHRRVEGLPGRRRYPRQAVVVCDISGSINELSVQRTFEVLDRLWGKNFDLQVIVCDTEAHVVTDRSARYSGGGTNMGAGLVMAHQKFPHAGVVMVVTDGHTPWPDEKPNNCEVVVLSWGPKGPEWATNVPMPGLTGDELGEPNWG